MKFSTLCLRLFWHTLPQQGKSLSPTYVRRGLQYIFDMLHVNDRLIDVDWYDLESIPDTLAMFVLFVCKKLAPHNTFVLALVSECCCGLRHIKIIFINHCHIYNTYKATKPLLRSSNGQGLSLGTFSGQRNQLHVLSV